MPEKCLIRRALRWALLKAAMDADRDPDKKWTRHLICLDVPTLHPDFEAMEIYALVENDPEQELGKGILLVRVGVEGRDSKGRLWHLEHHDWEVTALSLIMYQGVLEGLVLKVMTQLEEYFRMAGSPPAEGEKLAQSEDGEGGQA